MPVFSRHVTVDWQGPLREGGKGVAKAGSSAFNLPVSFVRRIAEFAYHVAAKRGFHNRI